MTTVSLPLACAVCAKAFQHGDGSGDAAGWAIFFMLCVVVPMICGIGFFIVRMVRREGKNLDPQFQDNFQLESASN